MALLSNNYRLFAKKKNFKEILKWNWFRSEHKYFGKILPNFILKLFLISLSSPSFLSFCDSYNGLGIYAFHKSTLDMLCVTQSHIYRNLYVWDSVEPGFDLKIHIPNSTIIEVFLDVYTKVPFNLPVLPSGAATKHSAQVDLFNQLVDDFLLVHGNGCDSSTLG